jgi:hypothetical protein
VISSDAIFTLPREVCVFGAIVLYTYIQIHTHTHMGFIHSFAFHRSFDTEVVMYNMMYADRAIVMANKA